MIIIHVYHVCSESCSSVHCREENTFAAVHMNVVAQKYTDIYLLYQ